MKETLPTAGEGFATSLQKIVQLKTRGQRVKKVLNFPKTNLSYLVLKPHAILGKTLFAHNLTQPICFSTLVILLNTSSLEYPCEKKKINFVLNKLKTFFSAH
jgi:hypothetical protein